MGTPSIAQVEILFNVGCSDSGVLTLRMMRAIGLATAIALVVASCSSDQPTAESLCLDAVGELQASFQDYEKLLDSGVDQMRDEDAVEKLNAISNDYASLLDELQQREGSVPTEAQRSHDLLVSGVGMQVSAWLSISDGLRFRDPDLIGDGAEMIELSRDLVGESQLSIPDCSQLRE